MPLRVRSRTSRQATFRLDSERTVGLLVNPDVADFESAGELGLLGIAAVLTADSQIEEHIMRLGEGFEASAVFVEFVGPDEVVAGGQMAGVNSF